jgi:hypothetical protein
MTASLVLAPAPPAQAKGPEIEHYFDSGSFVDTDLCGFPLRVSYRDEERSTGGSTRTETSTCS